MDSKSPRRVAHLDMDAFYASVELLRYPELRGQPVVVGGRSDKQPMPLEDGTSGFSRLRSYAGRGVVTTATYEARVFGISSGMGLMKAARLAPDAILLPADFGAYRYYSQLFKTAVARISPLIEDHGIDEIYIDLSSLTEDSNTLAQRIKQAVGESTGLSCSIGIAPNKLLAKICSDLNKPNGLTVLGFSDIPDRIWALPVSKINGIGPKANQKLATLGITTISELALADPGFLQAQFGRSYGGWLHEVAHGIDERPVIINAEPKSISRETTFERDLHARYDRHILSEVFTSLCAGVAQDLQGKGYVSRTISIKLRYEDFQTVTRDITLPLPTADAAAIRRAAAKCLRRVPLKRRLRLLGVRASSLSSGWVAESKRIPQQEELPLAIRTVD
ncbi:DNA polymerase-4 [Nitrosospira sp. Nsp14]|uniref:DNA polymerase IV n=1 Tax=Nitrosospira sp. Nsp14 TaxID=1855333 RepID=UPI0008E7B325|nr:DNA polymerase IV [Nitrosospira sp. Nsp14]SFH35397.1 DNA polymerase-4 [Nitrosospira sp. Nsp14]